MPNDANLPIALVGCGRWGQNILRDLHHLGCEVTAVCKTTESAEAAAKLGAKNIIDNVSHIKDPAGIIIATPTTTHLDVIESVLAFKVPIFVEKPLGTNLNQAKVLATKISKAKVYIMDKWRYHPGIEELARIAKCEELGPIWGLSIKQFGWGNYHQDVDFIDTLLPHTFSIAYEILGELPQVKSSYLLKRQDQAVALYALMDTKPWCHFNVAINSHHYCREVTLECKDGVAVLDNALGQGIQIYSTHQQSQNALVLTEKRPLATELPLLRELRMFLDYLTGGREPKSNMDVGIKIMEAIHNLRNMTN